ncbi:hypothetical protein Mpt1_c05000 [Candidatus Methanoplasma termitum]|uniref:Uncharacterized protein n=1 Tax=Candidatus Methanoplasma termitum TaxID=1577791 RepID=A0A0A7LDI9_9ARCH|nr:hypothetical protein [Candidatus Methanoplasma termitum]AIZ56392.1 hypothetical protein Mpt1_c05000 [Candidatus Methanoplasma termitum]MCL2333708.1 hypothetical protein [Candidatus Methanoplasma sp.]
MASERKQKNMRYGLIIGAVVGVAIFAATYTVNNNLVYLIFIPIAAAMGWATQYVKDDDFE